MTGKNITAVSMAAEIESTAAKCAGRFVADGDVCKRILNVCEVLKRIAMLNDGSLKSVDMTPGENVVIFAEVPDMDLYQEGLSLFSDLLAMVDYLDIYAISDEEVVIKVGVAGLWKAV